MLIDSNAYIGQWPFRQFAYNTLEALSERMKEFDTDISLVSNLQGIFYKNTRAANEELYNLIRSKRIFRNRFIPFAVINPIYAGWRDDLEICTSKMGMKGIRLYPKYHRYDIDNPACTELVNRARDKGLPVAFSLRMVDRRASSWLDIENEWTLKDIMPIIRSVPDAQYLITNAANSIVLDEEDLSLLKRTDMLVDTSGRNIVYPAELLNKWGKDKLCFGTHSPILDYATGLLRIESLKENEADENTKELLRSGNIKRFLKL